MSPSAIKRLVRRGTLHRRFRGVFALGHDGLVPLGDETAALLAAGPDAVLGSLSAGRLWNIVPAHAGDGCVHLLVARHGAKLPGVRVHRTAILTERDIRWRQGLPVASPARALLDLATVLTDRQLELAIDRALVARILRERDLAELLARSRGHPGSARLSAARAELDEGGADTTITRSEAEERFLEIVRRAELPAPLVNGRRHGYEIDFLWPEHGLAVEIDGRRFHATARAFAHDRRKDRDLFSHGIVVLRYPRRDLVRRALAVAAEVAAGLVRAAARRSPVSGGAP